MKFQTTCIKGHETEIRPAATLTDRVVFGSNADFCDARLDGGERCEAPIRTRSWAEGSEPPVDPVNLARTWMENVPTDSQLDVPVPALRGMTGRQLLRLLAD